MSQFVFWHYTLMYSMTQNSWPMIVLSSQKRYILGTGRGVFARVDMILYSTSTYENEIIKEKLVSSSGIDAVFFFFIPFL